MQKWSLLGFSFGTKDPFTIGVKNKVLTNKLNKNGSF